jgi:hypoxanthine phosphoribosyltransferase
MSTITVKNKVFEIAIASEKIQQTVAGIAEKMNNDFEGKNPLFLAVLNGSFLFAADLLKKLKIDCEISFVKVASYHGMSSSGNVKTLVGLNEDVTGRHLVIIEDIIDTGVTIDNLLTQLKEHKPASVSVATLLFKPAAYTKQHEIHYRGFEVSNEFLIGYGLDYDGAARNLDSIYKLKD